jgi:FkbM family methyltransferase
VSLTRARDLLFSNPALFCRKSAARLLRWVPFLPRRAVRNIRGVTFECDFALDPRIGDMFLSAYEPDEVAVLERYLGPGDVFVDVGANIGYLTAVGASLVGPGGQVHSFEPVPEYFARLESLRAANPRYAITVNAMALGEREGSAEITQAPPGNIGWNTLVPGMLPDGARHSVPVQRLDSYLSERGIARVALIKIDTEGFELPVLRGASGFLDGVDGAKQRPPILCEVAPGAYPLLGSSVVELFDYMAGYGYAAFDVERGGRPVRAETLTETINVLFVPGKRGATEA